MSAGVTQRSRKTQVSSRRSSGYKVEVGFNDLDTTHPDVAAQVICWDPTTVTGPGGMQTPIQCRCLALSTVHAGMDAAWLLSCP